VLTTESIENAPPGMKARYTLQITNEDEYTELFELAFSGKEFKSCSESHWKRKK
jgi:hypothetical protein